MEGLIFLVAGLLGTLAFFALCFSPFWLLARAGGWVGRQTRFPALGWVLPLALAGAVVAWIATGISAFRKACAASTAVEVLASIDAPARGIALVQESKATGVLALRTSFAWGALLESGSLEFVDLETGQRRCRGVKTHERQPAFPIESRCDMSVAPAVDVHLLAPQRASAWMPIWRMQVEVRDHRTRAVLVRATDIVFGGGLLGSFMRLFKGDQDYAFLSCGYLSREIGPWRPSLSTRPQFDQYSRADSAMVLAAHGLVVPEPQPVEVPLKDVPAVLRALTGVWKRDVVHAGVPGVETINLDLAGSFNEVITGQDQKPVHRRSGTWTYDGTNFTRTVTSLDGKRLRNQDFIYEPYKLKSVVDREFVASGYAGREEIRYSR
ncbi:MAG TPA: hypothetical protein VHL79_24080 [Ramlibacter sp.]|nr:hypothetical protein [Ramlibacter sp.]